MGAVAAPDGDEDIVVVDVVVDCLFPTMLGIVPWHSRFDTTP